MSRALTRQPETSFNTLLPSVDLANPATIHALPQWLGTRLGAISKWGEETEFDGVRKPTIPTSLTLTGEMRAALERRCRQLEAATVPGPEGEAMVAVGKMVRFFSGARASDATYDVKIDVYMETLRDLPAWAVAEACTRWYRGETGGESYDYQFAPAPGILRQIAQRIASAAAGQIVSFRRLLSAVPFDDPIPRERDAGARLIEDARQRRQRELAADRARREREQEVRDAETRRHWQEVASRLEQDSDPIPHPVPETNEEAA